MKIKKGDTVIIRSGRDKGKTGTVTEVLPQLNKVVVDGINIVKRALKPTQKHPKGGIVESPAPLDVSNVGLVHPDDKQRASRIGYVIKGDKKVRVYRQSNDKEVK
ncbi:MAG: 50S ribosomal protein L24 [Candidatus Saccharimonadales bacterium]